MLIGCFGDAHITKNMRTFQDIWEESVKKSIHHMYNLFDEASVEAVVCLGDFFDAPKIEAKHLSLLLPILEEINSKTYPTYFLLGNHEIHDNQLNILDFLNTYDNIIPITELKEIDNLLTFIPYNVNVDEVIDDKIINHYVFTHHDIYGSELVAGKTKAFFGIDPIKFKKAKFVFNGHVHLKSNVGDNIVNAGSLLSSSQGELKLGDYPSYYIIDTQKNTYDQFNNYYSMIYLTISDKEIPVLDQYSNHDLVLRVNYSGELPEESIEALHVSYRKLVEDINNPAEDLEINVTQFDLKNYLVDYLNNDESISNPDDYISVAMKLLS